MLMLTLGDKTVLQLVPALRVHSCCMDMSLIHDCCAMSSDPLRKQPLF